MSQPTKVSNSDAKKQTKANPEKFFDAKNLLAITDIDTCEGVCCGDY